MPNAEDPKASPDAPVGVPLDTVEDVLEALTYCEIGQSPVVALMLLLSRRQDVTERLLAEIGEPPEAITAKFEASPSERFGYFLHTFAVYAFAYWEEPKAFQPLVAYLGRDTYAAIAHLQDTVVEDLHTILARIYDGSDLGALKRIIEDDDAESYVREACLKSLHVMARLDKLPREDVVAYYADVLEKLRGEHNSDWSDSIVLAAAEMQEPALRPAIDRWLAEGLVEPEVVGASEIDRAYRELADVLDEQLLQAERFEHLVDYLGDWAWFNSNDPADFDDPFEGMDDDFSNGEESRGDRPAQQPVVRISPKIGRNEPCPCGSGQKYKKCCLVDGA